MSSVTGTSLLSYYQGQTALSLLTKSSSGSGSSSNASNSSAVILQSLLAKEGISSSSSSSSNSSSSSAPTGPAPPWNTSGAIPSVSDAVQNAVDGAQLIDPSAAKLSAPGGASTKDYQNLFALYQGLNTLSDLAQTASATSSAPSSISPAKLQAAFASGMTQLQDFLSTDPFSGFNVTPGTVNSTEDSSVGIPNGGATTYTTGIMATGDRSSPMAAFQGDVQFTISVQNKYAKTPTNVNIDLSNLGSRPRTVDNVVNYINSQLKAAGVQTTFSVASLGNASTTTTVDGVTNTVQGAAQWGLTVNGVSSESVSFSAPSTAAAVYVSEASGGANTFSTGGTQATTPTGEQLIKLQTGNSVSGDQPAAPTNVTDAANLPSSGVYSQSLPSGVNSVQASATAADGSVYMVADVSGSVGGAPVPGAQGVALLKYDAAGKLLYSKVLAGEQDATGYSIAVNTDGSVAVAGSNATAASTAANGAATAATTTAFVQVFDPTGVPTWSQSVPARGGTATAGGVAFGADGSVYLNGTTTGSVGDQASHGDSDEFIQGFDPTGKATFTTQFGVTGGENVAAGMVYDSDTNSLITAGTENSQAVVRSFSLNTGTKPPTPTGTRSLGEVTNLVGIGLTGGQIVVGGNVVAPTIHAANVSQSYTGLADGFVASISANLTAAPSDTVAYVGTKSATQVATGMAVADGQAYLTGTIAGDPHNLADVGATEGFVSGIDTTTGATSYSAKFTGANGQAAPSAIAVASAGSSVLDRLGLPSGSINPVTSTLITANTPIKAGDSFYIRTTPGGGQTAITVTATDTLTTLAAKITTALGSSGAATVMPLGANSELQITPSSADAYIELDSQQAVTNSGMPASTANTNVLSSLGLTAGVIRTVKTDNGLTDVKQLRDYGLQLPADMDISTAAGATAAASALQSAMFTIQQAYQDLANPPTLASEAAAKAQASGGTVPTYLTNEIANYQAGLNKLLGTG